MHLWNSDHGRETERTAEIDNISCPYMGLKKQNKAIEPGVSVQTNHIQRQKQTETGVTVRTWPRFPKKHLLLDYNCDASVWTTHGERERTKSWL